MWYSSKIGELCCVLPVDGSILCSSSKSNIYSLRHHQDKVNRVISSYWTYRFALGFADDDESVDADKKEGGEQGAVSTST